MRVNMAVPGLLDAVGTYVCLFCPHHHEHDIDDDYDVRKN